MSRQVPAGLVVLRAVLRLTKRSEASFFKAAGFSRQFGHDVMVGRAPIPARLRRDGAVVLAELLDCDVVAARAVFFAGPTAEGDAPSILLDRLAEAVSVG